MDASPYAKLTVKQLKLELEKRGKEITGRKEALIARLELADAEALSDMDDDEEEEEEEEVTEAQEKALLENTEDDKAKTENGSVKEEEEESKMETEEPAEEEKKEEKDEAKKEVVEEENKEENKEEMEMEEIKAEKAEEKKEDEKKEEKEKKSETDLPVAFGKGQKQVEINLDSDDEGEGDGEGKKKKQWFYQVWTPDKNRIAADIATHNNAKLLNIYPVQIEDLSDAQLLEVLPSCEEFSFNFYQKSDSTFAGLIYLKFNSVEDRDEAQTTLKFRDGVNIKQSLSDKEYQDIYKDFKGGKVDRSKESIGDLIERLLYITPLPKDTTLEELSPFFPEAEEIYLYNAEKEIETDGASGYAYVIFPEKDLAHTELLKHFDPPEPYKIKEDKVFFVNSCKEHKEGSDPMFQVMRFDKREFHMKSLKQIKEDIAKTPEGEAVCKKKVRAIRYHYRHLLKDEERRAVLELTLLEPTLKEVIPDVEKEVWKPSDKEEAEEKKKAEEAKQKKFQDRNKAPMRGGARGGARGGGGQRGSFQQRGGRGGFQSPRGNTWEDRRGGQSSRGQQRGGYQKPRSFSPGGGERAGGARGGRQASGYGGGQGYSQRFQQTSPQGGYREGAAYSGGYREEPVAYRERPAYGAAVQGAYREAGYARPELREPVDSKRKLLEKLSSLLEDDEEPEPAPAYGAGFGGGYKRTHDGYGSVPKRGRYDAYSQGRPGGYY